uniref:Uncharacterized protein n=1 Tax=Callorhinchus milii TaxID=7868 RepID=A0A4W3GBA7_CALMI
MDFAAKWQHVSFSACPSDRIVFYPVDLYEEGGQVFCHVCCHTVDHVRKFTVDEHMKSQKHCECNTVAIKKKQRWIWTSKITCPDTCFSTATWLTRANIPLEKAPAFQDFLCNGCYGQESLLPKSNAPISTWNLWRRRMELNHRCQSLLFRRIGAPG